LLGFIYFAEQKAPDLKLLLDSNTITFISSGILVCGILLSFTCTLIAVNRHLKYRTTLL